METQYDAISLEIIKNGKTVPTETINNSTLSSIRHIIDRKNMSGYDVRYLCYKDNEIGDKGLSPSFS